MLAMSQDVHLAVPRQLSHRAIPDGVVMALGYWAVLEPNRFTISRPSSPACKLDRTPKSIPREEPKALTRSRGATASPPASAASPCTQRLQVFWHDWVYAGSQSSIAKVAQVAQAHAYMVNITTRCLGLCQEEQTVLQLQALGIHLSPLGWRNISIQRLEGGPTGTVDRLVGGFRGPCTMERTVLSKHNKPGVDADEDVFYRWKN